MPILLRFDDLLYRFAGAEMPESGIVAPGGLATVKRHLEEGGYDGSGLFSMQQYVPKSFPAHSTIQHLNWLLELVETTSTLRQYLFCNSH